jgi:hypothetical protein
MCLMVSRSQLMSVLAGAVFLAGCAYVGYANELLKEAIPPLHRAILMIGFILGAGAASRWIMVLDIKRNMTKIKRIPNRKSNTTARR